MHRCTVTNLTGGPSRALVLIAEGSGRIAGLRIVAPADAVVVARMLRFDRWIGLVLERPVAPGDAIDVEIGREPGGVDGPCAGSFRTLADPLVPSQPFLETSPLEPAALSASRPEVAFGGSGDQETRSIVRRLEVHSLAGAPSALACRQAAAMWWLDSQTHPRLLAERGSLLVWPRPILAEESSYRIAAISTLSTELAVRAARRQRLARGGERDPAAFAAAMRPLQVSRPAAAMLAEFLRRGFAALDPRIAHPTREDDDVDPALLAHAIMAFAAGDLRLECALPPEIAADPRLTECAPDGPFFFLFAEIAMVAARMRLHGAFWAEALSGFVAAQHCYRRAYGDPAVALSRDELVRAAQLPPKRSTPLADREREYARLRGRSLDELEVIMGENLHATLRDPFAGG